MNLMCELLASYSILHLLQYYLSEFVFNIFDRNQLMIFTLFVNQVSSINIIFNIYINNNFKF